MALYDVAESYWSALDLSRGPSGRRGGPRLRKNGRWFALGAVIIAGFTLRARGAGWMKIVQERNRKAA